MYFNTEEYKVRSLTLFGFDVSKLNMDKIMYVPMHEYRIAIKDKPMLYIDNLQCCIGLYAYSENFGFAAHINPIVLQDIEYSVGHGMPIHCRRVDDLKKAIINSKSTGTIKVGISYGCAPLEPSYPTVKAIYDGITEMINELKEFNIEQLEDRNSPEFILDVENSKIILPKSKQKTI